jgi:outer membrane protein assembly factor BamA
LAGAGTYGTAGFDLRRYEVINEDGLTFKNALHGESQFGDPVDFRSLKVAGPYGIRGYRQFRDVGIGHSMFSNTAELAIPLEVPNNPIGDLKLVGFTDVGLALGNERQNELFNREDFLASFGVGLEINVPFVGPMRVDYGIPLIRPGDASFFSGRVTVNVGNQL